MSVFERHKHSDISIFSIILFLCAFKMTNPNYITLLSLSAHISNFHIFPIHNVCADVRVGESDFIMRGRLTFLSSSFTYILLQLFEIDRKCAYARAPSANDIYDRRYTRVYRIPPRDTLIYARFNVRFLGCTRAREILLKYELTPLEESRAFLKAP